MKPTQIAIAILACAGTATAFAGGGKHAQTSEASPSMDAPYSGSVGASPTTAPSNVGTPSQNYGGPAGGPSGVGSPGEATPPLPRNEGSSAAPPRTPVGSPSQTFGGPPGGPSGVGSSGEVTPPVERAQGASSSKGKTGSAPSSSNPPVGTANQNFGGPTGGPSGVGSPGEATPPIDRVQRSTGASPR